GAKIEIEEADGMGIVRVASNDSEALAAAMERVNQIAFPPEAELGAEYDGKVVNITKFGAFVNILPGRDGLLHISRLDGSKRVERVEDYLAEGDELKVRVREIDRGKVSLELVEALEGATLPDAEAPSGGGGGRDRGGSRDRGSRDRGARDRGGNRGGGNRDRGGRDSGGRDGGGRDSGSRDSGSREGASQGSQASQGGRRRAAQSFDEAFEKMGDN
ncbi:MAG: S1 RNA-binding domain-containing protein, partial [Actinomycetota bacterium]|nr:S1 RNA-binding domain-containing protein [Actinomycetota bacterium]